MVARHIREKNVWAHRSYSGGDAASVLQAAEGVLDAVPLPIERPMMGEADV